MRQGQTTRPEAKQFTDGLETSLKSLSFCEISGNSVVDLKDPSPRTTDWADGNTIPQPSLSPSTLKRERRRELEAIPPNLHRFQIRHGHYSRFPSPFLPSTISEAVGNALSSTTIDPSIVSFINAVLIRRIDASRNDSFPKYKLSNSGEFRFSSPTH